jgi:hypothetical protein
MTAVDPRVAGAANHVRYWLRANTFGMGEHDRNVLQILVDAVGGAEQAAAGAPLSDIPRLVQGAPVPTPPADVVDLAEHRKSRSVMRREAAQRGDAPPSFDPLLAARATALALLKLDESLENGKVYAHTRQLLGDIDRAIAARGAAANTPGRLAGLAAAAAPLVSHELLEQLAQANEVLRWLTTIDVAKRRLTFRDVDRLDYGEVEADVFEVVRKAHAAKEW